MVAGVSIVRARLREGSCIEVNHQATEDYDVPGARKCALTTSSRATANKANRLTYTLEDEPAHYHCLLTHFVGPCPVAAGHPWECRTRVDTCSRRQQVR